MSINQNVLGLIFASINDSAVIDLTKLRTMGSIPYGGRYHVEIKELIKNLKQVNPYVESNIFKSVENVNLDTVISYKKSGEKHHFLDDYDR